MQHNFLYIVSLVVLGLLRVADSKCVFGHNLGDQYLVEQTYSNSEQLEFMYTCQSMKFNPQDQDFFFYKLLSCKAGDISYAPGDTWRNGAFLYECFFRVTQEEGSVSEVRHIGCYVQDYLIMKEEEALMGNYRFACDDLGLHPVSCVSTKEALEMSPGEKVDYGLDTYTCNETQTGLSLHEMTREEPCDLSGEVSLLYLIDTSESIKQEPFDNIVKPSVATEVDALPDNFKVRLASYSTNFKVHTGWITINNKTRQQLADKVNSIPFLAEGTKTAHALQKSVNLFKGIPSTTGKILVLITDGIATDADLIPEAARELKEKSIKVVSVGVGEDITKEQLSLYGYTIVSLDNLEQLREALTKGLIRCKIFERTEKIKSATEACMEWAKVDIPMESQYLPQCPPTKGGAEGDADMSLDVACNDKAPEGREGMGWQNCKYNKGATVCYHSKIVGIRYGGDGGEVFRSRNQCCYAEDGNLITDHNNGAGTAQKASQLYAAIPNDIQPAEYCREAGLEKIFYQHRPTTTSITNKN